MNTKTLITIIFVSASFFSLSCTSCQKEKNDHINTSNPETEAISDTTSTEDSSFWNGGAGFRYSSYGPSYNPGHDYWANVGVHIAGFFGDSCQPECIWILGSLQGEGCYLNFPAATTSPYIFSANTDYNKAIFDKFEALNYKVWLQVEPGMANVDTLIDLVMKQYAHYTCITGFGIDVEWYQSTSDPMGVKVTDDLARRWVNATKKYNPEYRIFLKHWLIEKMPDNEREGIVFVDDSQMFEEMESMVAEFEVWGKAFEPAKVGFQYGYPYDQKWWKAFENPAKHIGDEIIKRIPNTESIFWVDFTILETYPPADID